MEIDEPLFVDNDEVEEVSGSENGITSSRGNPIKNLVFNKS